MVAIEHEILVESEKEIIIDCFNLVGDITNYGSWKTIQQQK